VKRASLTQNIYKELIEDIKNATLEEGDLLTESELATKYNVSKTPVREALRNLENEGLIITIPHKGYMIKVLSTKELKEITFVRKMIETTAVELAINYGEAGEIAKIKDSIILLHPKMGIKRIYEINYNFHMAIIKVAGNKTLEEITEKLYVKMMVLMSKDYKTIHIDKANKEHIQIYDAIEAKNIELAKKLMVFHIDDTQERIFHLR